ncbi:hypothetical protein ACH4UR_31230 [Streptomyces lydicus]|uniref:hypothetical protein n=1 Tax=Streptomyces lydicus TaxID=47763 RepID=UPI00340EEA55
MMGTVVRTVPRTSDGQIASFDGQLDWNLTTVPDPVQISPANGTVETADLILIGSRSQRGEIDTNQISVDIPTGTDSAQLALDLTGIQHQISLDGWSGEVDTANQRVIFRANSGHATIGADQSITIQLNKVRINRSVGTSALTANTTWRPAGDNNYRPNPDSQILPVGKFPPGFYLRDLKASASYIDNGDNVTFTWERSTQGNETYHLLYEGVEINVTAYSEFTASNVTRNTMFYLRGRVQQGTETAERTLNAYITVNRPDLEVSNLKVHGEITGGGLATSGFGALCRSSARPGTHMQPSPKREATSGIPPITPNCGSAVEGWSAKANQSS